MKQLIDRSLPTNGAESKAYIQLKNLVDVASKMPLSTETINSIEREIDQLNNNDSEGKMLLKSIKNSESGILKVLLKNHKFVPKSYYQKLWMVLGMSAFGVPIGVAFGLSIDNLGMIGIGLPIGMAVGIAVGSAMDAKVKSEGRQFDFEIK